MKFMLYLYIEKYSYHTLEKPIICIEQLNRNNFIYVPIFNYSMQSINLKNKL